MAKVKRAVSPGGALLRSSRLFSLPRAIPDKRVPYELKMEAPASSTRPHPTRQTITSPQTSREKGDWGLKRPLPLKQTIVSTTPLLRIKELDSDERITDYSSAADLALTFEKFQEMHMAMTVPRPSHESESKPERRPRMSPFEQSHDFTVPPESDPNRKGWKFRGPWLASMPEGEFEAYIAKKVLPRRTEFRQLMRQKAAAEATLERNRVAREKGNQRSEPVEAKDITDEKLGDYMRSLRNHRAKLYEFVTDFLDLPSLTVPVGLQQALRLEAPRDGPPNMSFDNQGPPPSHPSAGLSYLRTNSFMDNHFLYGPQAQKKPVLARLLQPQFGRKPVMVGVGGFVAEAPLSDEQLNSRSIHRWQKGYRQPLKGVHHLDIESHGGAKAWVVPERAYVDPNGVVVLKLDGAQTETKLIAQESRGAPTVYNTRRDLVGVEEREREAARYDQQGIEDREEMKREAEERQERLEAGKSVFGSASAYGLDSDNSPVRKSPY